MAAGFAGRGNSGLVVFPAVRRDGKDVRFYLRTLLREFVGNILDGLDSIVKGLEGTPLETPRETLDGHINTPSSSSLVTSPTLSAASTASSAASRASSFFSSLAASTQANGAVGGGQQPASLNFAQSPGSANDTKSPAARSSAAKSSATAKKTSSLLGAGPLGAGRYCKVKADYALLSGDLWAAISEYDACATWLGKERALAGGQDAVWYASALEGWAVTRCLIFRMSGLEEKGPSLALPSGGTKDKKDKEAFELPFAQYEWGEVAEAYALALQIYSKTLAPPRYLVESVKSVTSETPRDYTHPLIHSSACIAYARLLLAIWASSGWNAECFDQLIYGGVPPALVEDARPGPAMYAALSKDSGVRRHEIAVPTSLALSHSVAALKPPDQIAILCSLANVYGCIGFARREAYLLRQLQAAVVSLLARALILNPREPITIASALRQIAGPDHTVLGTMVTQTLTSGLGEGADAVLILALQICETYGINVDIDPLKNIPPNHILSRAAVTGKTTTTGEPLLKKKQLNARASWGAQQDVTGELDLVLLQEEAAFGWADLQIALLKDTICVAEMLQDHVGMAFFATVLLRDFHEVLSGGEQVSLMRGVADCVRTARWQDAQELEVQYWGPPEPICSIETVPLPPAKIPTQHPARDLIDANREASSSDGVAGLNNPFFWNPSTSSMSSKQATLVQGERAEFLVTLQNPFKAPLDLVNVRLSTMGADFEADVIDTTLPPLAYHTIALTGTPRGNGNLTVRGCYLTLVGCPEREFKMTLADEGNDKLRRGRESEADDRRARLKTQGLDARPAIIAQKRAGLNNSKPDDKPAKKSVAKYLERLLQCRVVPDQPMLRIDSPSLTHGQVMLFDGEETTLKLRLTNVSSLPIDFARLTFSDDLSEEIQASLSEGDLLPADAHQLEWQLLHQPVLSYDRRPRSIKISPGRSVLLPIKLRGKLDCTRGTINVDFAHLDAPGRGGLPTEETKNFYTRRVSLSFGLTVYPLIEMGALDIKPLGEAESRLLLGDAKTESAQALEVNGDGPSSSSSDRATLLSLNVRNVHQHTINIDLTLDRGDSSQEQQQTRTIPPGSTAHLILPLAKLDLPLEQVESPIPSLSSRQFILSKIKLSPMEERRARRCFWYRSELLRRLSAQWIDPRSGRKGTLHLEEQTLTDEHVQALQLESLSVDLRLASEAGDKQLQASSTIQRVSAPAEECIEIEAVIRNSSPRPLKLLYRLAPLPSSSLNQAVMNDDTPNASRPNGQAAPTAQALHAAGVHSTDAILSHLLITDGSLSCPIQPWPLPPGETTTVKTGVLFLAQGDFGFVAAVEEVGGEGLGIGAKRRKSVVAAGKEDQDQTKERSSAITKKMLVIRAGDPI